MKACARCGSPIAVDSLEGLCARCLLDVALADASGASVDEGQESQTVARPAPPWAPGSPGDAVKTDAPREAAGAIIGNYKLLQLIGEGGFGSVFMAEQQQPVRRRVALKIIKLGMDTKQVIARFEAERQALAIMDHPNIARVFEAGATTSGRPYFVMELIKGVPIVRYCDELNLSLRERLELFVPVCQAIQHAHQKGIIHRDIKPSNVLIAMQDGQPIPKVIDFGVAKALHQKLADQSMYTEIGQVIGTLEYMSPEQAELSAMDVDTRTDVYALGVVLYELLTGTTPLNKKQLGDAAFGEMLRLIRDVEPPRPSTRLTESRETLAGLAARRRTEPARLTRDVRGELDWIVMKALEKDRMRRYESASGLARDVERYLRHEAVEACPQSAGYRLKKFARKHRPALLTVAAVVVVLALAVVISTWQAVRATRAETAAKNDRNDAVEQKTRADKQAAIALAVNNFLGGLLRQADVTERANNASGQSGSFETKENPTIKEVLDRAAQSLAPEKIEAEFPGGKEVQASILRTVGDTYSGIGEYDKATQFLLRAASTYHEALGPDDPTTLATLNNLGLAYTRAGKLPEAIALFTQLRDEQIKMFGINHPETINTLGNLAKAYQESGKLSEAIAALEQVRDAQTKAFGADDHATLNTLNNLALVYEDAGKKSQAIELLERVRDAKVRTLGPDHPDTQRTQGNLASAYLAAGNFPKAIELLERVKDAMVRTLGPDHPDTLDNLNNLAGAYQGTDQLPKAIALYQQVYDAKVKKLGPDHPLTLITLNNLAGALSTAGKKEDALPLYRRAAEGIEKRAFQDQYAGRIIGNVIGCEEELKLYSEAEGHRRKWLAVVRRQDGVESEACATELLYLGLNLLKQDKPTDAEPVLRECVAIRDKLNPQAWRTFNAISKLGTALLAQRRYTDAEPLLLKGYEGMKLGNATSEAVGKGCVVEAIEQLVQLYDAQNNPDETAKWRDVLQSANKKD